MTKRIIAMLMFVCPLLLYGQVEQTINIFSEISDKEIDKEQRSLIVDQTALGELLISRNDQISVTVPFQEDDIVLQLKQVQPFKNKGIKVQLGSGNTFQYNEGLYYVGKVDGRGFVTASFYRNKVKIYFESIKSGNWQIEIDNSKGYHILKKVAKIDPKVLIESCGLSSDGSDFKPSQSESTPRKSATMPDLGIYFELDHVYYLDEGADVTAAVQSITDDFVFIQAIYANQGTGGFSLDTHISSVFVWDIPDPYPLQFVFDRLNAFVAFRTSFSGDVAVLLSKGTHITGGVAEIDLSGTESNLCGQGSGAGPYCLANFGTQDIGYRSYIASHEIGHVLGGRHVWECRFGPTANRSISTGCAPATEPPACNPLSTSTNFIMSYCLLNNPADYDISQWTGEIIENNLCGLDPTCFYDENAIDNDGDGYLAADDCDDNDQYVPNVPGAPCDDGDPTTINDVLIDTGTATSCDCQGTAWENDPGASLCNAILGGTINFEELIPGRSGATVNRGLVSKWAGIATPDVFCNSNNKFAGFLANQNANGNLVWEGVSFELSHPIPADRGQFDLTYKYRAYDNTPSSVLIQGSTNLESDYSIDTDCNGAFESFCFGTNSVRQATCFHTLGNQTIYQVLPDNNIVCNSPTVNWCTSSNAGNIQNTDNDEVNYIHISYDPSNRIGTNLGMLAIDDIEVDIKASSYLKAALNFNGCNLNYIIVDSYCSDWTFQVLQNGIYQDLTLDMSNTTKQDISKDRIRITFNDQPLLSPCTTYRVHQLCGPCDFDKSSLGKTTGDCGCGWGSADAPEFDCDSDGGIMSIDVDQDCQVSFVQWFQDGIKINGENGETFMPSGPGNYSYTFWNGACGPQESPEVYWDCVSCDCEVDLQIESDGPGGCEYLTYSVSGSDCEGRDLLVQGNGNVLVSRPAYVGNGVLTVDGAGTYTITISDLDGCPIVEDEVTITNPCPYCDCSASIYNVWDPYAECEKLGFDVFGEGCLGRPLTVTHNGVNITTTTAISVVDQSGVACVPGPGTSVLSIPGFDGCFDINLTTEILEPCIECDCKVTIETVWDEEELCEKAYYSYSGEDCVGRPIEVTHNGVTEVTGVIDNPLGGTGLVCVTDPGTTTITIQGLEGCPTLEKSTVVIDPCTEEEECDCEPTIIPSDDFEGCVYLVGGIGDCEGLFVSVRIYDECGGNLILDLGNYSASGLGVWDLNSFSPYTTNGYCWELVIIDGDETCTTTYEMNCTDETYQDESNEDFDLRSIFSVEEELNFKVSPNPAQDVVSINFMNSKKINQVQIMDINGKVFYSDTNIERTELQIDISSLVSGLYFVSVSSENEMKIERLVVN